MRTELFRLSRIEGKFEIGETGCAAYGEMNAGRRGLVLSDARECDVANGKQEPQNIWVSEQNHYGEITCSQRDNATNMIVSRRGRSLY